MAMVSHGCQKSNLNHFLWTTFWGEKVGRLEELTKRERKKGKINILQKNQLFSSIASIWILCEKLKRKMRMIFEDIFLKDCKV